MSDSFDNNVAATEFVERNNREFDAIRVDRNKSDSVTESETTKGCDMK
jgi:hypothetical protein